MEARGTEQPTGALQSERGKPFLSENARSLVYFPDDGTKAGAMTQQVIAFTLTEDCGSVPSTPTVVHNLSFPVPGNLMPSSGLLGTR